MFTLALAVCSGFVLASGAEAQTFQGGLRGAVKDAQGVVPGVTVTLINEQTNISLNTVTTLPENTRSPRLRPVPTQFARACLASRRSSVR